MRGFVIDGDEGFISGVPDCGYICSEMCGERPHVHVRPAGACSSCEEKAGRALALVQCAPLDYGCSGPPHRAECPQTENVTINEAGA